VTAIQQAPLLPNPELYAELTGAVDARTLEILERRRKTAVIRRRGWLVRRMLLFADVTGLTLALLVAEWIVNSHSSTGALDAHAELAVFGITIPAWIVIAKLYGLYDHDEERTDHSTADDFAGVFHMVTVCTWLFLLSCYVSNVAHPSLPKLALFWCLAVVFVTTGRASARAISRRSVLYLQNAVIVGAGDVGQLIAKKLLQHPEYGINLVGFVDSRPKERREALEHLALLGPPERLESVVRLFDIERVIVAFSNDRHEETLDLIRQLKQIDKDIQIDIVPRLFETFGPNVGIHMLEGVPLIGLPRLRLSRSSALVKRAVDLVLAATALLSLLPLLVVVAAVVKFTSRGPALYRHERIGRRRKRIQVLKFRTMYREACRGIRYGGADAEDRFRELLADPRRANEFEQSYKLIDDPRVTAIGAFLRRTSLDELPQLWNVIRGDISLVGPRAITTAELGRYGDRAADLLAVRPGITGYWQINGRSQLEYIDRVRLDLTYIASWSLRLDFEIMAKTIRVLIARRGAV
jgi:exopolysaccharide biosynthesis polyprenyl glycosylphosphotransferase